MVICTDQNPVGGEVVPDILSQGKGRESGPWPRRVAAIVVLVLAGVVIVLHLPSSRDGTARPARAAATVTAAASSAAAPVAGLAAVPDGISGSSLSWPGGLRLATARQRPAGVSPGAGPGGPNRGLPPH